LDLSETLAYWLDFSKWLAGENIHSVSVPRKARGGKPHRGPSVKLGWVTFSIPMLTLVLTEFADNLWVVLGNTPGRQAFGAPMGDPLSNAVLRIWKWGRECACPIIPWSSDSL